MSIEDQINRFFARLMRSGRKKALQDIVAVDFDPLGVACVRMKKVGDEITVVGADVLRHAGAIFASDAPLEARRPYALPRQMCARHVAICVPGEKAVVKLLSFQGALSDETENQIKALMGVKEGDYRVAHKALSHVHSRSPETKLLTVAFPSSLVAAAINMFPIGVPAPISVEVAGIAALTAFLRRASVEFADSAVGIVETGSQSSFLAFFNKGQLALIRKFDFGFAHIIDAVQRGLGVDGETAMNIIADSSFDISQLIKSVSEPFIKQLVISKHFVERREDCHVGVVFVSNGMPRDWRKEMSSAMVVDVRGWSPFAGLNVLPGALSSEHEKASWRFSAAVGAGLGVFEESSA